MIKYKSLAEERPDLLKEWNYEKNDKLGLDPNKISAGVRTKVWWKCKHGHEWQATIVNRVKGTKCPICTNHQIVIGFNDLSTTHPALAEEWNFDKNGDLLPTMVSYGTGKKVWWKCKQGHEWQATINSRTNAAIGCPYCSGRLVLAGYNDLETLKPDLKTEWNYEKNGSLLPNMVSCGSGKKVWWKCNKGHEWKTSVSARVTGGRNHQGVGCPICSNKQILVGYNDLATVNPELLKEWNYDKNNKLGIYPNKVTAGSGIKVWWKCNKGHEWKTSISGRTGGNGCPVCANQIILEGYNDLATVKPDLAKEWNYEKNGNLLPTKIGFGSAKKVWWKCDKGHEWQAVIRDRYSGKGCPVCSNRKIITGYNDLVTLKPKLAKEWNYEKNNTLLPSQVSIGSAKKVWWKCNKGHEWQATIGHRALSNTGCPECFADKQTSFAEQAIFYFLDMCFPGEVENRCKLEDKQGFIEADIYLPKLNIVIEYDGAYWHKNRQEKDLEKECRFKAMGMRFIRIAEHNRNKVIENYILYDFYKNQEENLTWAIRELFIMLDISPLFVNISAFRDKILEFSRKNEVNNSLAVVNPELAKEWNYEKNGKLLPTMFTCGSQEKVWWKCSKCGHEWQASVANRNKGRDCPLCKPYKISKSLSKVRANNSLQEKFPQVAKEWNYEKNGTLTPDNINFGSGRKVW